MAFIRFLRKGMKSWRIRPPTGRRRSASAETDPHTERESYQRRALSEHP